MPITRRTLFGGGFAMVAAVGGVSHAHAESQAPPQRSQDGSPVWDRREHELPRGTVLQREENAGIAPGRRQDEREGAEVEQFYRNLMPGEPDARARQTSRHGTVPC